jgi:hypothetical protein
MATRQPRQRWNPQRRAWPQASRVRKRLKADQCGFALSSRRYPIAWRAPTLVTRAENLPQALEAVTSCHFRFGRVLRRVLLVLRPLSRVWRHGRAFRVKPTPFIATYDREETLIGVQ